MKLRGIVKSIVGSRIALVRLDGGLVGLGTQVLNRNRVPVGNVTDIIGPVKEPYAVVVLKKERAKVRKEDIVFFRPKRG